MTVVRAKTIVPASSVVRRRMLGLTAVHVPKGIPGGVTKGRVSMIALDSNAVSLPYWM